LPEGQVTPVPLQSVLDPATWESIRVSHILADADVIAHRQNNFPIQKYTDVLLRSNTSARLAFLSRLYSCGILGFSQTRHAEVSPFFVKKKLGRQRLVLDCRQANQCFRNPPRPDLGCADSLQNLETSSDFPPFIGSADIKNCFYQCGILPELSEWLAFAGEEASFAARLGCTHDIWGNPLPQRGTIYPVLLVLPMGWNWSFWIVQRMRVKVLARAGIDRSRLLVSSWPAPPLGKETVAMPYCDNLAIIGLDPTQVNADLTKLMNTFTSVGFELHEVEFATAQHRTLAAVFDVNIIVSALGGGKLGPSGAL
jgi:hypothetical protein